MFILIVLAGLTFAAPVPKAAPEPEWMLNFRKAYELKEGEYVKRVAAPYIHERIDFLVGAFAPPKNPEADAKGREMFKKDAKWFTLFIEQDGKKLKKRMTLSSMGLSVSPQSQRGDNLFEVSSAVESITGFEFPEFLVDPKYKNNPLFEKENLTVHGDWIIRKNAPHDKLATQLEAILQKECQVPVKLRVDQVEQDVFVVSGEFKLKPPEWRQNDQSEQLKKLIDVFATEEGLNPTYDHFSPSKFEYQGSAKSEQYSGFPVDFVRFVGLRVKTRMVWDGELPSEPKFSFCNHTKKQPTDQDKADDCNPDLVLKNISAQTGLTFKKEKRKVPVLVIYPGDAK